MDYGVYSLLCGWPMGVVVVVVLGMAVKCWDDSVVEV